MKVHGNLLAIAAVVTASFTASGQSQEAYTPREAMAVLRQEISDTINPSMPSNYWVSLSMVGAVAEESDPSIVNDLANFCPEPSPLLTSFARVRRLDQIYGSILDGLTGPLRPETAEYLAAREFLFKDNMPSEPYKAYREYAQAYADKLSEYFREEDAAKKGPLQQELILIEKDWVLAGYRGEVDAAFHTIEAGEGKFGPVRLGNRVRVLGWYRSSGLSPSDTAGAYKAPMSELSPPVTDWGKETGWLGVSYSNKDTTTKYNESSSNNQGFGGLSLGFVTIAGSGGGGNTSTSKVTEVYDFKYSFDLKRVLIRRPWLDPEVFYQPLGWTWKKKENTEQFPNVSLGSSQYGAPISPQNVIYDNVAVDCPMLPLEMIIARNRSLTATVSKTDYSEVTTSGSSGGGGSLFGIFGGGAKKSWSTKNVVDHGNTVTFTVEAPSIAVIGFVSEVIPKLPNANQADTWPENAWIDE